MLATPPSPACIGERQGVDELDRARHLLLVERGVEAVVPQLSDE
jgi:hypothetical protein